MKPIESPEDLEPLTSFYAGILGEKPGRLMAALSLLADLELMDGWQKVAPEVRLSISLARRLTADVFKQLMAEQSTGAGSRPVDRMKGLIEEWTMEESQENGG